MIFKYIFLICCNQILTNIPLKIGPSQAFPPSHTTPKGELPFKTQRTHGNTHSVYTSSDTNMHTLLSVISVVG